MTDSLRLLTRARTLLAEVQERMDARAPTAEILALLARAQRVQYELGEALRDGR